jgi:hypothetical protein
VSISRGGDYLSTLPPAFSLTIFALNARTNSLNDIALIFFLQTRTSSKFLEGTRVGQEFPGEAPRLLGRVLQRTGRLALEEVQVGQEVVRAAAALQTRDELQENAIDAVAETALVPLNLAGVFFALVQQQRLHVVRVDRVAGQVEVAVAQRLERAEALAAAAALQQPIFGLVETEHPCVALHGRLLALHGDALLGQQIEALRLHLGHQIGVRPRDVRNGPVRRAARPHARALERRRDLHHVALADAQFHLGRVGDHFHRVPIAALVARLGHQRLEARADFARAQVARGRDELDPERHGALATVAEFQDGAAGQGAVVDEVEDAHLVEVEHHFELGRRDDVHALIATVALGEAADEARLLHLHLLQHVLHHFAHFADGLGDERFARVHPFAVVFVQLVHHFGLRRHHVRRHKHLDLAPAVAGCCHDSSE